MAEDAKTHGRAPDNWTTRQLGEFLTFVASYSGEPEAIARAVEHSAEVLDAEVAALLVGDVVIAAVGFAAEEVPVETLVNAARETEGSRLKSPAARRAPHRRSGRPPPPAAPAGENEGHGEDEPSGETLTAELKLADGTPVATADIEFPRLDTPLSPCRRSSRISWTPGFHGLHIHSVGSARPIPLLPPAARPANSIPPVDASRGPATAIRPVAIVVAGGPRGRRGEIGDHDRRVHRGGSVWRGQDRDHHPREGRQLRQHSPERYQQVNGNPPPDETTLATGDAGKRWRAVSLAPSRHG